MKRNLITCLGLLGLLLGLLIPMTASSQQATPVKGKVLSDENLEPMPGVTITVQGSLSGTVTDELGEFSLNLPAGEYRLAASFLGYATSRQEISVPLQGSLEFRLVEMEVNLSEVEVVSTGYEQLPKERATGSFVLVDEELVNRKFSINLLDRLEDVTPGLMINQQGPGEGIRIRGRNTLFANTDPLIIVDNFPYDGPLESINPNDVESMTVLRDAAAASIWGARAGNGVIVITTKSGLSQAGIKVSLNTAVNFTEKPDLYYNPVVGIDTYLDVEEDLFSRGLYEVQENRVTNPPLSPWVETLIAHRDGLISDQERNNSRTGFASADFRQELYRHYYRPAFTNQQFIGLETGGKDAQYAFSAGYDGNQLSVEGNETRRITFSAKGNWNLGSRKKLRISTGFYYTGNLATTGTEMPEGYAYERLADDAGNPLPLIKEYSRRFVENNTLDGLLDWRYIPLEEKGNRGYSNRQDEFRANLSLAYQLTEGLSAELLYQGWFSNSTLEDLHAESSFYTRELINRFTQVDEEGNVSYPVPQGSILDRSTTRADSYNLRGQVRYEKTLGTKTELTALAGSEVRELQSMRHASRYYGYQETLGTSETVPYTVRFPNQVNGSLGTIPDAGVSHPGSLDRFVSMYGNTAFTYDRKYTLSGSVRRDASNLFGVNTNQKGVPLWSTGLAWMLSEEGFYTSGWMPYLKIRGTYGYSGNIDKSVTAFLTARALSGAYNALAGLPYAQITNPPNPDLRWEKIRTVNLALDFATKNDRISGSIELYSKLGSDLFGDFPVSHSSGVREMRGNFAETLTRGIDLQLVSKNITGDRFNWDTRFFLSTVKEKVTKYDQEASVINFMGYYGAFPVEGRPLFGVYSYPWAGLDPDTGDPQGVLEGEPSTDYLNILTGATAESVTYHGPSRPTVFGGLMNNFSYGGLSLSFNISYRLGYYYKRASVDYVSVYSGDIPHADFSQRWINPGDEQRTDVPSMPANSNSLRDLFYAHSELLVEKADNIRLQDVRIAYSFNTKALGIPMQRLEWYLYANNLGVLWKSSNDPLDPDYRSMRPLRSFATGVRIEF